MAHKDFFDVLGRISQTSTSHNLRLVRRRTPSTSHLQFSLDCFFFSRSQSRCFTDEQRASVKTCVAVARDVLKLPADARVPPPVSGRKSNVTTETALDLPSFRSTGHRMVPHRYGGSGEFRLYGVSSHFFYCNKMFVFCFQWDNATETVVVPALRQKVIDVMTSLSADQKQSVAEATQQCVDSGVEFKPNPLFAHKHKPVEWIDAEKDVPEEMKLEAKKRMRGLLCLARSLIASVSRYSFRIQCMENKTSPNKICVCFP